MSDRALVSRRRWLGTMGLAAIASMVAPSTAPASDKARSGPAVPWVPAIQLYTLGLKATDDLAAAFRALAAIGYREVEFPGHYERSAADLRRALDATNLSAPAIHVSPAEAEGAWDIAGDVSRLASDLHLLGARYAIVPMPLSRAFPSIEPDDWKRTADLLNEKGAALAKHGVRIGYHNHGVDFVPLKGDTNGFRLLVERTDPKLVDIELDIGWAVSAGQELPPLFRLLGDRLKLLHLKDTKHVATKATDLASTDAGTGIVKWKQLVELVRQSSIEHMFVEQEAPFPTTPMDAAKLDIEFLTKLFAASTP